VRSNIDMELLTKIDMLFQYFFHQKSAGAFIDENNQIIFKDGKPE
jgi:hypothetical protein